MPTIDMRGQKFNRLTVLKFEKGGKNSYWRCVCDCGTEVVVSRPNLKHGLVKSCGCANADAAKERRVNLAGQKFGFLAAISVNEEATKSAPRLMWNCLCDCGKSVIVKQDNLISGNSQSCGCLTTKMQHETKRNNAISNGKFFGVSINKNAFKAECMIDGKRTTKYAKTAIDAAKEYDKMAFAEYGEDAVLNFPEDWV